MKTFQLSAIIVMLCIGLNATAQTSSPSNSTSGSSKTAKQQGKAEKEQWLDMYNNFKPKLDDLKTHVDQKEPNSQYAQDVSKLDQMAGDFRSKIDQYDAATPEQQKSMRPAMEKQKSDMDALYKKAKAEKDQMKSDKSGKSKTPSSSATQPK